MGMDACHFAPDAPFSQPHEPPASRAATHASQRRSRRGPDSRWHRNLTTSAGVLLWTLVTVLNASAERPLIPSPTPAIAPWQDDANLHDLQMLSGTVGYAAGDHGMVWWTEDGGRIWQPRPVPLDVSLRSLCFLTDKIGCVAGQRNQPYTGLSEGVLFLTNDGGQTWEQRTGTPLPGLHYVRFFSLEEAVVVGQPTALAPSGIYRTKDAGETWTPVPGEPRSRWLTAQFFAPEMGIVAGRDAALTLVGGDQLLSSQLPPMPSRAIRDIAVQNDDSGWIVGDGGLVMTTNAGGVSWTQPPTPLPEGVRESCDFRAVSAVGDHVWLAGSPGSMIWHSPDRGQTWSRQSTGQTLPLTALQFVSPTAGFAVGELGVILQTADGGQTWQATRGAGRKAAWLAIVPKPDAATLELAVKLSADSGYRGVIWSASEDVVSADQFSTDSREAFPAAMQAARGNVAGIGWQLPLDQPDLAIAGEALLQSWQRRAENRAPMLLVEQLVRQLRTYRPDVVILPEAPEGDALASLIQQATQAALRYTDDSTRALHLQELAGLPPWQVARTFQQLPSGSSGDVQLTMDEFLSHLGDTLHNQTRPATTILRGSRTGAGRPELPTLAYRRVNYDASAGSHVGGFFAGIDPAPGSESRRHLAAIDEQHLSQQMKAAQRQRNFRAISQQMQTDPLKSAQLIGQLPEVLRDLNADQAAVMMSDLAVSYRQQSKFELAESTYLELIRRHPDHPAAIDAMSWLLTYWSSGEIGWLRSRDRGQQVERPRTDMAALRNRIIQAGGPGGSLLSMPEEDEGVIPASTNALQTDIRRKPNSFSGAPPDDRDQWRKRALALADQLQQQAPQLFQEPKVQLPLGALKRATNQPALADQIYRRFPQGDGSGAVSQFLERELWAAQPISIPPRQMAICKSTRERPHLDGVLSDPCWQEAQENPLGPAAALAGRNATSNAIADAPPSGLVMFAYDQEFLYVAAIMKAVAPREIDTTALGERDYDAPLTGFDRLGLALDCDRDYVSWYQLEIDERGQTADTCWEDSRWNPQWYVARQADADRWQLEIAIPWSELAPQAPFPKDIWALSAVRTVPYAGHHPWGASAEWPPRWYSFGLLRFE